MLLPEFFHSFCEKMSIDFFHVEHLFIIFFSFLLLSKKTEENSRVRDKQKQMRKRGKETGRGTKGEFQKIKHHTIYISSQTQNQIA